ncbi:MAG: protein BatD [Chitinophagaceae bacterium]|nr:MAG: protein BatD [Chitinophagaceae bacterium]
MKKLIAFPLLLLSAFLLAQPALRTIVTPGPVAMGEPFQVQYVLHDMPGATDFELPSFKSFKVISGPQVYNGQTYDADGKLVQVQNVVYTLEGIRPGKYSIAAAAARFGGKWVRSRQAVIEITEREFQKVKERSLEDYYLYAGEDPYQKIKKNLFLRVEVDKRSCYVGQPVTAVFKLYSSLESRTDIVKNPGLFGFTVQDMVGLRQGQRSTELLHGKKYEVYTIRKVQMYPLRAGTYEVDPMEVRNRVEFYKAIIPGKTEAEQTIREGVLDDEGFSSLANTVVYETSSSTEPVKITVKAIPEAARPDSFNGATGKFSVQASVVKNEVRSNEEGILELRISGAGNFTQLTAPDLVWPAGVTAFDPEVKDILDPQTAPLQGQRIFRYHFICSKAGRYELPALSFSFFNPDSNRYHTVVTGVVPVTVIDSVKKRAGLQVLKAAAGKGPGLWLVIAGGLAVIAAVIILFLRKRRAGQPVQVEMPASPGIPPVSELLADARMQADLEPRKFYAVLRSAVWKFFSLHFALTGSQLGRNNLVNVLGAAGVSTGIQQEIAAILDHCETGMFTDISSQDDQLELLAHTTDVLEEIEKQVRR